jgi:hypothetical protein
MQAGSTYARVTMQGFYWHASITARILSLRSE